MAVTCVLLAAGLSRRFGSNKLLHATVDGETLLERAVRACGGRDVVAVCLLESAAALRETHVRIVINHEPDRGMTHSLMLANAAIDPDRSIAVLPADLALIEAADLAMIIGASGDADVTFPVRPDGTPGHPVIFSAAARRGIGNLADGDTIRELRDRADLRRTLVPYERPGPFTDVDTPEDVPQPG